MKYKILSILVLTLFTSSISKAEDNILRYHFNFNKIIFGQTNAFTESNVLSIGKGFEYLLGIPNYPIYAGISADLLMGFDQAPVSNIFHSIAIAKLDIDIDINYLALTKNNYKLYIDVGTGYSGTLMLLQLEKNKPDAASAFGNGFNIKIGTKLNYKHFALGLEYKRTIIGNVYYNSFGIKIGTQF